MGRSKKAEEGSINTAASNAIKDRGNFNLNKFKTSKHLSNNSKYKEQTFIHTSPAIQAITSLPGIPEGHITLLRGHSDTGKTTAMLEIAINAQKMGRLPVFIITEMKWSWAHAITMGLQVNEVKDENGEVVDYEGHFIYVDRSSLNTIEDVAGFMSDLLDEQQKGNLPYDLCFFWDSIGSVPCKMSVESKKNSNEWNAGAMSTQFGNFLNQQIVLSRKASQAYTNTLVAINKIWVDKPMIYGEQPKMKNKNGQTMYSDASLILTFGNVTNAGTSKNHLTGIQLAKGTVITTIHGFILEEEINDYKKAHSHEWEGILGSGDYEIVEDKMMEENIKDIPADLNGE